MFYKGYQPKVMIWLQVVIEKKSQSEPLIDKEKYGNGKCQFT